MSLWTPLHLAYIVMLEAFLYGTRTEFEEAERNYLSALADHERAA
jgi:hypothetical protein